jgi:hypothetical protein
MEYHLAQVNVGRILGPMDDPVMAEFAASLDRINAIAEQSPGFIWRLKDASNNATSIPVTEDRFLLINMSVWRTVDELIAFVYHSPHSVYVRRRAEWFERLKEQYMCCWWVPAGHEPSVAQAMERIGHIRREGPTPLAFTFKQLYTLEQAKEAGVL